MYMIYDLNVIWGRRQFRVKRSMDHNLVASAATGSVSSALLWILREAAKGAPELPPFALDCPSADLPFGFWIGVGCGFLLWPVVEIVVLAKQWLVIALRSRIAQAGLCFGRHHKVLT